MELCGFRLADSSEVESVPRMHAQEPDFTLSTKQRVYLSAWDVDNLASLYI